MSLDPIMYTAFQDELIKLGGKAEVLGKFKDVGRNVGRKLKGFVSKGWHDPMLEGKIVNPRNPAGPKINKWNWLGTGGEEGKRFTKYLPVGGKSVLVGMTAATVPGVLKKEDPYGMQRSRAERITDLGASTIGGLAGTGALMSLPVKGWQGTRALAGGFGGAMLAARLATMPWRRARKKSQQEVARSEQPAQYSDYTYKGRPLPQGLSYQPWEQG